MLVLSTKEPEVKREGITELIASWRFGLGFLLVAELPKMRFMTEADLESRIGRLRHCCDGLSYLTHVPSI